ncbi:MAG: type II and III secretion system protein family protein [Pseudomonadota bacterium]
MSKKVNIINPGILKQLLLLVMLSLASVAMAAERVILEFGGVKKTSEMRLSIGKSQIIYSQKPLDQVVIGNPEIADIKLLSSRQVLILGSKPGHTNLVFRDKNRSLISLMDVVVGYDLEGIKRKLYEVMPHEEMIQVRGANDSVMLSGEVSDALAVDAAVAIAASYVPKNKVLNMLQVAGGQQVMLEVKIAEITRDAAHEFGIGLTASNFAGTYSYSHGALATTGNLNEGIGGALNIIEIGGSIVDNLTANLRLLEGKGLAKTLAEPNLVAMSGQEASFLAGGEFPYQIVGSTGNVGNEFKEFGVGLKFTPTVLSSEKINLKFNSEVSTIVDTGSPPSISTRRTATTVEMADGQSFAVAGLLQSDMQNAADQIPGLGDIPILGALFRSSRFQRQETELVVIVTPHLVKPVAAGTLVAPTDSFVPPSWLDQYLMGNLEASSDRNRKSDQDEKSKQKESGLDGQYGHKVYEPTIAEAGGNKDLSDQYEEKANGQ